MELSFLRIRKHSETKGTKLFENCFTYTCSIIRFVERFTIHCKGSQNISNILSFLKLKPNTSKYEIAEIKKRRWFPLSNSIHKYSLKKLLSFYKLILISWSKYLSTSPELLFRCYPSFRVIKNTIKLGILYLQIPY